MNPWIWPAISVGLVVIAALAVWRLGPTDEPGTTDPEHQGAQDDDDTQGFFAALHDMDDEPLDEEEREVLAREREFVAAFDDIEARFAADVDRVVAQAMTTAAEDPAWAGILTGAWPVYRAVAEKVSA